MCPTPSVRCRQIGLPVRSRSYSPSRAGMWARNVPDAVLGALGEVHDQAADPDVRVVHAAGR